MLRLRVRLAIVVMLERQTPFQRFVLDGNIRVCPEIVAKSNRANIDADEEKQFKEAARYVLGLTETQIDELIKNGDFVEVRYEQEVSK